MNISVCITVFNEEQSISALLDSLLNQTRKPDEIVIVDGGSRDKTIEIINHFQQKDRRIKLLKEKCSRAEGRNLSVETAKNEIIAITDAGCLVHRDWLEQITEPFRNKEIEVSAGFYKMVGESDMSRAMSVYLGVTPGKFDVKFLPSTRSIAFKKRIWEQVGGFPENLEGTAEDTIFDLKLVKSEAKIARVKTAIVEWGMPESLPEFFKKIRDYAKGDAESKNWVFPGKGITSHNIKAIFVLLRYIVAVLLLVLSFKYTPLFPIPMVLFLLYLVWAFRKVFLEFGKASIAIYGPVLQITADLGVIIGLIDGLL